MIGRIVAKFSQWEEMGVAVHHSQSNAGMSLNICSIPLFGHPSVDGLNFYEPTGCLKSEIALSRTCLQTIYLDDLQLFGVFRVKNLITIAQ